jgi:2-hydroxychromene-2-carboxylate isomerase|tara:strand:- start:708 stop:1316 length:609 start_codon:yes stop_codon:yes gene_type:complete
MTNKLEFFYDCSSPWTYLAFEGIEPLSKRQNYQLIWKPILVGGIFNLTNPSVYESRSNPVKEKLAYSQKDMKDWSKVRGVEFNWPDIFPINSVKAMRGSFFAINEGLVVEYSREVFRSYWTDGKDISNTDVLSEIVESLGMDAVKFLEFIDEDKTKEALKKNTQELIERGGFGSPTIYLNETDMYFGNDRLHLIEELIKANN